MHKALFILSTILLAPLNGYAAEKFVHGTDTGPTPVLEAPSSSLLPTVNIAEAKGWPEGESPVAAPGFEVTAFAEGLDHPRWVYVLPNGDVLVAESNKPAKPNNGPSIKGFFEKKIMKKAGAVTKKSGRGYYKRKSNYAAARYRWRRQGRNAKGAFKRIEFSVGHGVGG